MSVRPAILASLALGVIVAPTRRAAVTTKYRIETKSQSTIDLTAFGQAPQEQNVGLVAWVAVTLSDTTGGRVLHVVVDSLKYDGTIPVEAAALDSVKGATLHGLVEPSGRIKNLTANPTTSLVLAQIHGVMNGFFPRLKTGLKGGDTWTDATGPGVTVMVPEPDLPSLVAVIVAVPTSNAVATPELETVATPVLLDAQVTVRPVSTLPFASFNVAVN